VGLLALVSQPRTVWDVLSEMAPRLAAVASIALLASIVVAWVLAASIARPLASMTRAAEAISRGQYEQEIPHHGRDEVGRLSAAFNAMAREVARSQRTLRDFVANVSHDLRTPLTSIQGFSQAMVDGALREPAEYAEAGRVINEEAGRMRRLVEDLLELSKIESGQVVLTPTQHDLRQIAIQAVERAERRAIERSVSLAVDAGAAPLVWADGRWLERAIDNLVDNAVRHTPVGGEVLLAVGRQPGDGRPFLRVHNDGSYIPPDELARVFERFYQLDKSRAGSAEGSGLGLAIAQEIVQAHGGRIVAESSQTGGTAFAVILP
jgi:signal transduction histidine kinase